MTTPETREFESSHLIQVGRHHKSQRLRLGTRSLIALVMAAVFVAVVAFGGVAALRLTRNLSSSPLNLSDQAQGENNGPLDILILGSDTRQGAGNGNREYPDGKDPQGLTDVMMLMHVTQDRDAVTVISLPRDLVVKIPQCTDPETGVVYKAETAMLNSAVKNGGPGCTVAAVNTIVGVEIDHFMLADFNAVKELSSAVGGVQVCVNQAVDDSKSGLKLPAGISSVQGDQALACLRSRAAFGNGGDESRIRSQQAFLASLTRKIKAEGTLENIPQLYRLAEVMTQNLHVDESLTSIPRLVGLGTTLAGVDLSNIAFVTVPTMVHPDDPNRLALDPQPAQRLFATLHQDRAVTQETEPSPSSSGSAASDDTTAPARPSQVSASPTTSAVQIDPATVPVSITNHSSAEGRGQELVKVLRDAGYSQARSDPGGELLAATQVFYNPSWQLAAQQVAQRLNIPTTQMVATYTVDSVQISVGEDFLTGKRFELTRSLPNELRGQTAEQFTCQDSLEE